MSARVGRLLGQVFGLVVAVVVILIAAAVALPFILLGLLAQAMIRLLRVLTRRGDVPDALTPELARRIDGTNPASLQRLRDFVEEDPGEQLDCGCLALAWPQATCRRCSYRSCVGHADATHYCEPVDKPDPLDAWLNAAPRLRPANLDGPPESVPSNAPAGGDFTAWEQECTHLNRWAKKLGGKR